jgi:hypothetical protein
MSVPSAPQIVPRPLCRDGEIVFYWQPPADTGGSAITAYTLYCPALSLAQSIAADQLTYVATGITNQIDYAFSLTATNSTGEGPAANFRTVQTGSVPYGSTYATVSTVNESTARLTWDLSTIATEALPKWIRIRGIPSTIGVSSFSWATYPSRFDSIRTNLSTNCYYQFSVQAVNDVGYSYPPMFTDTIGFGINAGTIVTDGLLINFNADSYSGSGSTWTNVGSLGSGYDATVTSGSITKNMDNNGIVLNGSTYLNFANPNLGNNWTLSVWYKLSTPANGISAIVSDWYDGTNVNASLLTNYISDNNQFCGAFYNGGFTDGQRVTFASGEWQQMTVTWNGTTGDMKTYVNGALTDTFNNAGQVAASSGSPYYIGTNWDNTYYVTGELGQLLIYSRPLTDGEVAQNYAATQAGFVNSPFTPTGIADMTLWLDAADASSVTLSGSDITAWADKSGEGNSSTLKLGGLTYSTNVKNGNNVSVFNGGALFGNFSSEYTGSSITYFFVGTLSGTNSQYASIMSIGLLNTPDYSDQRCMNVLGRSDSSPNLVSYRNLSPYTPTTISPGGYDTYVLVAVVVENNVQTVYLNGTQAGQVTYDYTPSFDLEGWSMGNSVRDGSLSTQYTAFSGVHAESAMYTAALSTSDRQKMEGYLAWKWGMQSDLPVGHPYKNAAP